MSNKPAVITDDLVFVPPTEVMPMEQWIEVGEDLSKIDRGIQWAVGDWINYGIANYHDALLQATLVLSHAAPDTLARYAEVAAKFERDRRNMDSLEWSHYKIVSRFLGIPSEQDKILAEAAENEWTVRRLEQELGDRKAALSSGKSAEEREADRAEAKRIDIVHRALVHKIAASTKERAADVRIPRDVFYTTVLPKIKDPGAKAAAMEASAK